MLQFSKISVSQIISTSAKPIFSKFAGLEDLWLQVNDLKLFFRAVKGRCHGNEFLPRDAMHPRY